MLTKRCSFRRSSWSDWFFWSNLKKLNEKVIREKNFANQSREEQTFGEEACPLVADKKLFGGDCSSLSSASSVSRDFAGTNGIIPKERLRALGLLFQTKNIRKDWKGRKGSQKKKEKERETGERARSLQIHWKRKKNSEVLKDPHEEQQRRKQKKKKKTYFYHPSTKSTNKSPQKQNTPQKHKKQQIKLLRFCHPNLALKNSTLFSLFQFSLFFFSLCVCWFSLLFFWFG